MSNFSGSAEVYLIPIYSLERRAIRSLPRYIGFGENQVEDCGAIRWGIAPSFCGFIKFTCQSVPVESLFIIIHSAAYTLRHSGMSKKRSIWEVIAGK